MARDGKPSYLKAAFLNVYNLSLLGGALAVSAVSGEPIAGAVAIGLEALWLLFGPDLKPFQRAVNQGEREAEEARERTRVKKLTEGLPEREWQRAHAIDELRREIERDMQVNPSFQAILLQTELDKLARLHMDFVQLAAACVRAETYLAATDLRDLHRQIEVQESIASKGKDASVKEIAGKNVAVLRRRLTTLEDIQSFLARARGQMTLIENSVRLLRDQVLTMASPTELGEQLDDLLVGVEALQASAKENEALFSKLESFEPEPPEVSVQGGRVRG